MGALLMIRLIVSPPERKRLVQALLEEVRFVNKHAMHLGAGLRRSRFA
jgi:hypothetical protein